MAWIAAFIIALCVLVQEASVELARFVAVLAVGIVIAAGMACSKR